MWKRSQQLKQAAYDWKKQVRATSNSSNWKPYETRENPNKVLNIKNKELVNKITCGNTKITLQ